MGIFLHIDPGPGSMLFTILIGLLGAAYYFLRDTFMKVKYAFSCGKIEIKTKEEFLTRYLQTVRGIGFFSQYVMRWKMWIEI